MAGFQHRFQVAKHDRKPLCCIERGVDLLGFVSSKAGNDDGNGGRGFRDLKVDIDRSTIGPSLGDAFVGVERCRNSVNRSALHHEVPVRALADRQSHARRRKPEPREPFRLNESRKYLTRCSVN